MAIDFLHDPGTNGFIQAPFNLIAADLNGLTSGSAVTSALGPFNQTNFASAQMTHLWLIMGGALSASPTAGDNLSIWFLRSDDGGNHFEATPPARAADATFNFASGHTYAAGDRIWEASGQPIGAPWPSCKVYAQLNTASAALPATGTSIQAGPVADHYN